MTTLTDTIHTLRESLDCRELTKRYSTVQLDKHSKAELCGPCPKCAGTDRFYVSKTYAACRQCHTQRMDAVGLVAWLHNVSQHEAVAMLNGGMVNVHTNSHSERSQCESSADSDKDMQPQVWRDSAATHVLRANERLHSPAGAAARDYLLSRGLTQDTWQIFELGYVPQVKVPGQDKDLPKAAQVRLPAVSWPVYSEETHEVVAVRYRFIGDTPNGKRYTMRYGSQVRERLFGVQSLPDFVWLPVTHSEGKCTEQLRCLVLCEGEINAMSIWQVAYSAGVDVLSTGSESQKTLPAWVVDMASRYGVVVTWFDKADIAAEVAQQLPQAVAMRSPEGQDANDILLRGLLGGLVQQLRLRGFHSDTQRERVLWQLWDVANGAGLDASTAQVAQRLASELDKSVTFMQDGDRWRV